MPTATRRAGGRATEAGMAFQAEVGMWFAAHLLARAPVGARFGLSVGAYPVSLRLETGDDLDDVEVTLSDGGRIVIQCKTNPNLSRSAESDLAATIAQVVSFIASSESEGLQKSVAVMAVLPSAAASLNSLHEACCQFAMGGDWPTIYAQANQSQRDALDIFRTHVTTARTEAASPVTTDQDVVKAARFFRIDRFAGQLGGSDWREASNILGSRVYGAEECGPTPLAALLGIVRTLIRTGAPCDREGLLQQLRVMGHEDSRSPQFDQDLLALKANTQSEIGRLERHSKLPIAGGLPIIRECLGELQQAAENGSFLVVGEPGAGKTGVLVALARGRVEAGLPTVLLSVDDLAWVASTDALRGPLGLQNGFLETLGAWPGSARGVLIIDALDASRGGPGESVFSRLIEQVQETLSHRWSVVASIRSFDLRNSRKLRDAMAGNPPCASYVDPVAIGVRHFLIPLLTENELAELSGRNNHIDELLTTAPGPVRQLLCNVFNLSLAAALLEGGASAASIKSIATQSDLIDCYEDERLLTSEQQAAVAHVVTEMVRRRRLVLRKVDASHPALDEVLRAGVLVASGDRISFAHHVLFDHVTGRFFLDWNDTSQLMVQLSGSDGIGLLLGPALRFTIERLWRDDSSGRPTSWNLIADFLLATGLDPIVANIALRATAERVEAVSDTQALCALIGGRRETAQGKLLLSRVSRYASICIDEMGDAIGSVTAAWARVAQAAAATRKPEYADGIRILLSSLQNKANFEQSEFSSDFGEAARGLLTMTWMTDSPVSVLAPMAIGFVARSFASNPAESRQLLEQVLLEPRFSAHAHEEAPRLAKGVGFIIPADPLFAVSIYSVLFGRAAPSEGDSFLGGQSSQILPLLSNRRQDYEHSRWCLEQALPDFFVVSPYHATRAVSAAAMGIGANKSGTTKNRARHVLETERGTVCIVEDGLSYSAWRKAEVNSRRHPDNAVLSCFAHFLGECSPEAFRQVIQALLNEASAASAWARVLGIAADRPGVVDDVLWPIASNLSAEKICDLARDTATYLASVYPQRSIEERTEFETRLCQNAYSDDEFDRVRYWVARLLSVLPDDALTTEAFRTLKAHLEESGRITGNKPFIHISTSWSPLEDESPGGEVGSEADQQTIAVAHHLEGLMRQSAEVNTLETVTELWDELKTILSLVGGPEPTLNEEVLHVAWGTISNALESISDSAFYDPSHSDHPDLAELIGLLERLAVSAYPEPMAEQESDSGFVSWNRLDVRVYVARSLMSLVRRWGSTSPRLLSLLSSMLSDAVPSVRSQISDSLNVLWDVDRELMWTLMLRVASEESDVTVMELFVSNAFGRVAVADGDRGEEILSCLVDRFPACAHEQASNERELDEAIGVVTIGLFLTHAKARSGAYIDEWLQDPTGGFSRLRAVVSNLRKALLSRYQEDASEVDGRVQDRAHRVLSKVVNAASQAMTRAAAILRDDATFPALRSPNEQLYQSASRLLEHCCNQLYFGSGAFKSEDKRNEAGLTSASSMGRFLAEYELQLDEIAHVGDPSTIHHLVQLYEFLMDAAPELVFDKVACLLVGPAALRGYQYESLATEVIVGIIRGLLADYRDIFEDSQRRRSLVEVLDMFSNAGWPEAMKLLYELPDLMR